MTLLMKTVNAFVPNLQYDLGNKPWFMEPLITSAQTINIQEVEKEFPSEMEECIEHSVQMIPLELEQKNWNEKARTKYFSREKSRQRANFEPGVLYSFNFSSCYLDFVNYKLQIGSISKAIAPHLKGQPLGFEAKHMNSEGKSLGSLWCVEFIHDDLLS